jgi:hypothetical protein
MSISKEYGYDGDIILTVSEKLFHRIEVEMMNDYERMFKPSHYVVPKYALSLRTPFGQVVIKKAER